tara:strand:+ start:38578 stop:38709 length:132 start_codon:yes stop_codon:yes gene_type:complete
MSNGKSEVHLNLVFIEVEMKLTPPQLLLRNFTVMRLALVILDL